MRVPSHRELSHERLGERFQTTISDYDTRRRVEILVDEFLSDWMIVGKSILDVGCGLGYFSKRLRDRGATVVACDIGPSLVEITRQRARCLAQVADALELVSQFGCGTFDVVVSSECIEHTPDPAEAVRQMAGVLKPGGFLALSTPNIIWQPVVRLSSALRIRPYEGYENFSSWSGLEKVFAGAGLTVLRRHGLHLFPFHFGLHRLSRWCDGHMQMLRGIMINICLLGRKTLEHNDRM